MLDFDTFNKGLTSLQEIHEKGLDLSSLLGCGVIEFTSDLESSTLLLLEVALQDTNGYIGWWLYEDVNKIVTLKSGRTVDLTTPIALYNFLVMEASYGKDA